MNLIEYPNPLLATRCRPVAAFGPDLASTVDRMIEVMYSSAGVGLAAPQVGLTDRILVMDPSAGDQSNQLRVLINPEVTWRSPEEELREEGCLSLPGVRLQVLRPVAVEVRYNDLHGIEHVIRYGEWLARIAQHEIDHLDGVVMVDRVGPLARRSALRDLPRNR